MREGLSDDPLPLPARFLDGLSMAALAVAAAVLSSGGFVAHLGPIRFSSHSIVRPLLIAAALVAVRHFLWPARPLNHRLAAWFRRFEAAPRRSVTAVALFSRGAVLAAGYLAVLTVGIPEHGFKVSNDPLMNLPARFDAGWYAGIARRGYDFGGRFDQQESIAFFPAFPVLVRLGGYAAGAFERGITPERSIARALWAGTLISLAAFAWGAVFLHRLAREQIGEDRALAAVALLAAYPFAVFFSAVYTESLFLLATVAAFYRFGRREWGEATAWGVLAGLTRPNGSMLSVVLACLLLQHAWRGARSTAWLREYGIAGALLAAASPGLGMLAYSAYVRHVTGDWFGWVRVQAAWGRSLEPLTLTPVFEWIRDGRLSEIVAERPFDALNTAGLLFALLMLWAVFRHVGLAAGVFVLVNLVPPVFSGGVLSVGRMTSTLFPLFLALAAVLPRPLLVPVLIAFGVGQGVVAVLFFTWRPLF